MISKLELLTRKYLKHYLTEFQVVYNYRPDWLKNEKTGKNLELDIYYPDLYLAVEINGIQHQLNEYTEKDSFKMMKCLERGINFYVVWNKKEIFHLGKQIQEDYRILYKIGKTSCPIWQEKYIDISLFDRFDELLSKKLYKKIYMYEPSRTFLKGFYEDVKYKLKLEKRGIVIKDYKNAQKEETESIKRRMELKNATKANR